ncbi:alpha amylase C-terminal domain-containing protein [Desulfoluna limicola]|uniref:alpha amylase C-terminal domain-containing protein n=1 Tax=Desulfoluna limicola TaxID=2810562 RepID=UPI001EFFF8D3|nr:alpha amylase C-terminal domain-containing protein [Desulfoluna limicola]
MNGPLLCSEAGSGHGSTRLDHAGELAATLVSLDPCLKPYGSVLVRRLEQVNLALKKLTIRGSLREAASTHLSLGPRYENGFWRIGEWAPNATAIFLIGPFSDWKEMPEFALKRRDGSDCWEMSLPEEAMPHGTLFRFGMHWRGGSGDRIPSHADRVVQDVHTNIFNAQAWRPDPYVWQHGTMTEKLRAPLIYEAHVGMAGEGDGVADFHHFTEHVLPRIKRAGYNTLQLMGIPEHPYYGSYGYHVTSYFAVSSRFGPPEAFKRLVDTAHGMGLRVIIDMVHSHAAGNEVEGLSRQDGTPHLYFHAGDRGRHEGWDSRCFDYGKEGVVRFLLSNCRYWLEEYRVDGFRFDGVTSMIYHHRGMNRSFTHYDDYYGDEVDEEALVYLSLVNRLIHEINPSAITIAEDVSGMPGLAYPREFGGTGFDYRFAMGLPDLWTRLLKEVPDESWDLDKIWFELTNRREQEPTISYAESHDQALVGDQTHFFRMAGAAMYDHMGKGDPDAHIDRAMALHKMIRLITVATAGAGYLNFMGNEFGHPEWIDFPRHGNSWSGHYARRQWSLVDNVDLKYPFLAAFDREMTALADAGDLFASPRVRLLGISNIKKWLAFERGAMVFIFNFHATRSRVDHPVPVSPGDYSLCLNSDGQRFGGHGRVEEEQRFFSFPDAKGAHHIYVYLPARTALVLRRS